jgi:diacylglycerol kinase (ATP)
MKTMFIVNPISGKGKRRKPHKTIAKIQETYSKAGADFEIRIWKYPDHIEELIHEAILGGFEVVVAAGGDGTIHEIGHRLVGTGIALGLIPLGSGNGFARHLGYSTTIKKALSQLLNAQSVEIDTGEFGGIPFMNNAGIGIDADIARKFKSSKSRGLFNYFRLASTAFFTFKTFSVRLVVDGKREYVWDNLMLIDISNGSQWGGGAKIAPLSTISDGYLEAVILEKSSVVHVPRLLKLLFQGKLYRHPNIKIIRGKKFEISRRFAGDAQVDGEAVKLGKQICSLVHEKSMKLMVPFRKEPV